VRHRLAAFLLRQSSDGGKKGTRITLPSSNQELAAQIGTVRELVSRNLSRFQSQGFISLDGRTVVIEDVTGLEAELNEAE
jgi:CRP/FNR family transcriptional regulator